MNLSLSVEQIPTVRRDIENLDLTLFAFSISLRGMSKTISINWNKLGFSDESLRLLRQSGVKLTNIPVFGILDEYAKMLNRLRTEIEQRTLFVAEQRVVSENQINEALAEYQGLRNRADELRASLKANHQAGANEFRERITALLATPEFRIPEDEQPSKVNVICQSFISYEAIDGLLRPELTVNRIPSLSQQLGEQTQLKNELNALKQAQRQAQAESALQSAQEEDLIRSRELREGIFSKAKAEIESIVAEQIDAISKYETEVPQTNSQRKIDAHYARNEKARRKLAKHLKRMQVLFEIGRDESVLSKISQLQAVDAAMKGNATGLRLEDTLSNLRQQLQNNRAEMSQPENQLLESVPSLI